MFEQKIIIMRLSNEVKDGEVKALGEKSVEVIKPSEKDMVEVRKALDEFVWNETIKSYEVEVEKEKSVVNLVF